MNEEKSKTLGKKILTVIIIVIVTLLVLCAIILAWILIKNPLNVRGIIFYKIGWSTDLVQIVPVSETNNTPNIQITDGVKDNTVQKVENTVPAASLPISEEQRKAVESFGVDPDSIIITPAMEDCFVEKLGESRVNEIKQGATPGMLEMIKASPCL